MKFLGSLNIPIRASAPASPVSGDIYFNLTDKKFYGYTGSAWAVLSATSSSDLPSHNHDDRYYTETELGSITDGSSGADKIGSTAISGVSGTTVQAQLESFKALVDGKEPSISTLNVGKGGTGATSFTAGRILFGNGSSALATDSGLYWQNTDKRLGIGTTTPAEALDVIGAIKSSAGFKVGSYEVVSSARGFSGTTMTLTGGLTFNITNEDVFIDFNNHTSGGSGGYGWRVGYLGTGTGDANYFTIQSENTTEGTFVDVLKFGVISYRGDFRVTPSVNGTLVSLEGHTHTNDHASGSDNQNVFTKLHALDSNGNELTNSPYTVTSQTDAIKLKAGSNIILSMSGNVITMSSTDTNTTYSVFTSSTNGLAPLSGGGTTKYLRADGTWQVPPDTNTTYPVFTSSINGLAPLSGGGTTKYLRADGTWQVPPDTNTNTTYSAGSGLTLTSTTFSVDAKTSAECGTNEGRVGVATNGIYVVLGTAASTACAGNDSRLSDSRLPLGHEHDASNITSGILAVTYGGTGTTSFTAGRVLFGNGSNALNTNGNLFWDNSNSRLGLGTTTPNFTLDINGGARIRSSNAIKFGGTGAADSKYSIQYNAAEDSLDFVYG